MKNGEQPAFVTPEFVNDVGLIRVIGSYGGLTKREYFAAMAMQGILSNPNHDIKTSFAAYEAIKEADELLKQLES